MDGERLHPCAFELSDVPIPRRLISRAVKRTKPDVKTNLLAFLMTPASTAKTTPNKKIELFHAGGRKAEIEEVFCRILAAGVSLDQVACSLLETRDNPPSRWSEYGVSIPRSSRDSTYKSRTDHATGI